MELDLKTVISMKMATLDISIQKISMLKCYHCYVPISEDTEEPFELAYCEMLQEYAEADSVKSRML